MEKSNDNNKCGSTQLSTEKVIKVGGYHFNKYIPNVYTSSTFNEDTGEVTYYSKLLKSFNIFYESIKSCINPLNGKYVSRWGSNYGVYGCLLNNHFPLSYVDGIRDGLYCILPNGYIKKQEDYCKCCIYHADRDGVVLSRAKLGYLTKLISKGEKIVNNEKRKK